jgi:hypothetical protein
MEQLKQFAKETNEKLSRELIQGLSAEERIRGLSLGEILEALSPEDRLALGRLIENDNSSSSEADRR